MCDQKLSGDDSEAYMKLWSGIQRRVNCKIYDIVVDFQYWFLAEFGSLYMS